VRMKAAPAAMAKAAAAGEPGTVAGIPVGPLPSTESDADELLPEATPLAALAGIDPGGWKWLGPGNICGRTRSLLIHPTNPKVMWLGGVAGGVWRTTNGGLTWSPMTDFMASVAIASMAIDPNNPKVLYAGTGEGFYNLDAVRGFGIFKSTNGGLTWKQLASTAGANADKFRFVNRLAVAKTGATTTLILVATRSGLFRSTDGGTTFTAATMPATAEVLDVRVSPADPKYAVAGLRGGQALYSTDAGQNWTAAAGIAAVGGFDGRVELTYAAANPKVVYASVDDGAGKVYRSTDGGQNYALRSSAGHLVGQGWYANCLWAGDPTNPNLLLVGGLDLHRSTNGGSTFTKISVWQSSPISAHADHHAIVAHPGYNGTTNKTVFFGNDGGVFRAADVSTVSGTTGWKELNNGLGITQFYGAGGNLTTGRIVGGTQDNGTLLFDPALPQATENWKDTFGGDGGESEADPVQEFYYGEYVYLQIHRSQGTGPAQYIFTGIGDAGSNALFIAPFRLDPNNSNRMFAGGASLWRSSNVKQTPPNWKEIKPPSGGSLISAVAAVKGTTGRVWVGHTDGKVFKSANATAAAPTWTEISLGLPSRQCTRVTLDPGSGQRAYATFGGYSKPNLFKTIDDGTKWIAVGANVLPEVPFYDLAIHPDNPKVLILGTEVGLFVSDDEGLTWSPTNQGPTNAPVYKLFWMNKTLVAATHGRGLFAIVPSAGPAPPKAAAADIAP
jgi:photosystem II stability/assembly factor-like uncharacterized protein